MLPSEGPFVHRRTIHPPTRYSGYRCLNCTNTSSPCRGCKSTPRQRPVRRLWHWLSRRRRLGRRWHRALRIHGRRCRRYRCRRMSIRSRYIECMLRSVLRYVERDESCQRQDVMIGLRKTCILTTLTPSPSKERLINTERRFIMEYNLYRL